MSTNLLCTYKDSVAVLARENEANQVVPAGQFAGGLNAGGSNAPGIGVGTPGPLSGEPQQFTLLDQNGADRTPQNSQIIGGNAAAISVVENNGAEYGSGEITVLGEATLASLETGWESA